MKPRSHAELAEHAEHVSALRLLRVLRALVVLVFFASPAVAQQTHLLVITGVPGDEDHAKKFDKWAATFIDAAKKKESVPDANITYLSDRKATREGIDAAIGALAGRAKPSDTVIVLLIGHGSFDGRQAAFNIMGPDLTAPDWAKQLARLTAHVAFINTSSSSGAFLQVVSAPGRVVITATKTGGERLDTSFPEFFVEAFADDAADRDRNGHVSVLEAFEYAKTKVTQAYQQKGTLLTEHATIDDGGEGRAATMYLGIGRADAALNADMSDPAVRELVAQRDAIERDIAALKLIKATMDEAKYDAQMEKLLTDLALKTKALREKASKKEER